VRVGKATSPPWSRCRPLRRHAITAALNTGVSLRHVREFARHADSSMTIRYDPRPGASGASGARQASNTDQQISFRNY
jgi:hypothetical protein